MDKLGYALVGVEEASASRIVAKRIIEIFPFIISPVQLCYINLHIKLVRSYTRHPSQYEVLKKLFRA
jgi:hypothetical protein